MRGLKAAVTLAATMAFAPAIFTSMPASAEPLTAAAGKAGIFRIIELKGSKVKWGSPTMGTGTSVTYAFATAPVAFSEARNCRAMVPMDSLLAKSNIDKSQYEAEAAKAFDAWSSVADIEFRQVSDPAAADILIGAQVKPVGRAFTNVSYTRAAASAVSPLEKSLICLNPEQPWKVGFDGDLNVYDLRYTLVHEIGHAIGLDHPGSDSAVMSYRYEERFATLQPGDIRGVIALYGSRDKLMVETTDVLPASISGTPSAAAGEARDQQFRALGPVRD
jgi:predicted Zn-dependent protease